MNKEVKNKLFSIAKNEEGELLKLCSSLIRAKSVNPGGDIFSAIKVIKDFFDKGGIYYELIEKGSKEFPVIIARLGKNKDRKIFLNGHCDVVPVGNSEGWKFDPFSGDIVDGKMLGRGTSDMKCGLAGLMFMMKILKQSGAKLDGEIEFHIVSDEETGGAFGTKWLYENGYFESGEACIIAEPTSKNDCEVGQKGNVTFKFKVKGIPAHGSVGNYIGDNAILKSLKLIDELFSLREIKGRFTEKQLPVVDASKKKAYEVFNIDGVDNVIDHVTVNVGTIDGGTKSNVVPDYCETVVDTRLPIGIKIEEVIVKVDSIVEKLKSEGINGIEYEYTWSAEGNYTDTDTPLVKAVVENAYEVWHEETVPAYQWASSDARYYRLKGIPTIQYGPANTEGIHSYNETVDVVDIVNSFYVYIGMMVDLLNIRL